MKEYMEDSVFFLFWHTVYALLLMFGYLHVPYILLALHCFLTVAILFNYQEYITNEYTARVYTFSNLSFISRMIVSLVITWSWLQHDMIAAGVYLFCAITTNKAICQKTVHYKESKEPNGN
jgi:predicted membrane protein